VEKAQNIWRNLHSHHNQPNAADPDKKTTGLTKAEVMAAIENNVQIDNVDLQKIKSKVDVMVLIIKIMICTSASRGNKFIDSNSIVVEITDAN
jgi:hypothetical protein